MTEDRGCRTTVVLLFSLCLKIFSYMAIWTFLYWATLTLPVTFLWLFWLVCWTVIGLVAIVLTTLILFWGVVGLMRGIPLNSNVPNAQGSY